MKRFKMTLAALALLVVAAFAPQASAKTTTAPTPADTIDAKAYASKCGQTMATAIQGLKGAGTVDMGECGKYTREVSVRLATGDEIAAAGLPAADDNLKVNGQPYDHYLASVTDTLYLGGGRIGAIRAYLAMTFTANGTRIGTFQSPPQWTCTSILGFSCTKNARSSEWVSQPQEARAQADFTYTILGGMNRMDVHLQFTVDEAGNMYNESSPV